MSSELLRCDHPVHTRDAIELPGPDEPVEALAGRQDAYPIFMARSLADMLKRLQNWSPMDVSR